MEKMNKTSSGYTYAKNLDNLANPPARHSYTCTTKEPDSRAAVVYVIRKQRKASNVSVEDVVGVFYDLEIAHKVGVEVGADPDGISEKSHPWQFIITHSPEDFCYVISYCTVGGYWNNYRNVCKVFGTYEEARKYCNEDTNGEGDKHVHHEIRRHRIIGDNPRVGAIAVVKICKDRTDLITNLGAVIKQEDD